VLSSVGSVIAQAGYNRESLLREQSLSSPKRASRPEKPA
jgi:hypothetical protein